MTVNFTATFLQGALLAFSQIVAPVTALSYTVKTDGAALNDVVKIPFVTNESGSADFAYSTGYSGDYNLITSKDVTLNQIKYQPFTLTDADMTRLGEAAITNLGAQAGARLAYDVISASIATVVTNANFPTSASITANQLTASAGLVTLGTQADNSKWSSTRNLILGTEAYAYLLNNSSINNAVAYGSSTPIQSGVFQNVFGFTPYKVTCPLPNSAKGLVLNPNAILIGLAPHVPALTSKGIVQYESIVDNQSKMALGLRYWYDADKASTKFVVETLFGASLGDPNALFQMK